MKKPNASEKKTKNERSSSIISYGDVSDYDGQEIKCRSYMPSPFIVAALPARDVKKNVFVRKYNNVTLRLTGGIKVPFGKYGRLLLTVLTTHAVINKNRDKESPVVISYKSLGQLMRELQLPNSRGAAIKEQLDCFANASFIFEERVMKMSEASLFKDLMDKENMMVGEVKASKVSTGTIPFIKALEYYELENKSGEKQSVAIRIMLSDDFSNFSQEHSVPIDYSVYKNISSAIGKDLYAWLVYRNNSISGPLFISRESLVNQFMPIDEDSNKDQLRTNWNYLKDQIKIIQEKFYPELRVRFDDDGLGLTLFKSRAPLVTDNERYILVTADL